MPNAVGSDGRLAVRVTAPDSWFWLAAVLDPLTGRVERVWPNVNADLTVGWADDGRLMGVGNETFSSLWRFMPR